MNRYQTVTSTTLLNAVAQGGDAAADRAFYDRYSRLARAVALHCEMRPEACDDVIQETIWAATQALREHRYDREQGRFKAFFKGVLSHKINDARYGRRLSSPAGDGADLAEVPDKSPGPAEQFEAMFEAEWHKAQFEEALAEVRSQVEPQTWQAYDLYVNQNWRPADVAKLLGISRNAIYIAKSRVLDAATQLIHTKFDAR